MRIIILDLESSNVHSLVSALEYIGLKKNIKVVKNLSNIDKITHLIMPGVGSFDYAMKKLKNEKSDQIIKIISKTNVKILGICLGLQLLMKSSEEGGSKGLGIINSSCKKLFFKKNSQSKVPNVGFKELIVKKKCNNLYDDIDKKSFFYFTHSYALMQTDFLEQYSITKHNNDFVSSFSYKNIYGCQFHPEKSQSSGLIFLKNFFDSK
tara:strand:+ start:38 stop:661 length:624 start_codon:yes stop_codon:yes gene_type:complete